MYGGAIGVIFQDLSSETTLHIKNCNFHNNYAWERGGGALQLGYANTEKVANNQIVVEDSEFIGNSAGWGGAAAFFVEQGLM